MAGMSPIPLAFTVLAVMFTARPLAAQEIPDSACSRGAAVCNSGTSGSSIITVAISSAPLRLDPSLAADVWLRADSITDFRQREPLEGSPATQHTTVKVARDSLAVYVAVRANDEEPSKIRATQLRRDADLTTDDNVTLIIDSFHDRRSAFEFRTNPLAAMWDAQLSGQEDENADWNGIWDVAVSRDAHGWTAIFRIPFRTLRFKAGSGTTFGFNVRRFIRRNNEEDLWRSFSRTQGLTHLQFAGELTGFGQLDRRRDVDLRPYMLGRAYQGAHDSVGNPLENAGVSGKLGGDVKIAVSSTLTSDLTVNTDFAQVEVDQQVINLTRLPTFFPEKREFFLESSGIFDFGAPQLAQLFYSRRIGLTDSGTTVPILGGARLYGKAGPWTIGALDARTGGADGANDVIMRVKHDLFDRSFIGAIAMQRSGPGVSDVERAGGLDIDLPLVVRGQNIETKLWVAATHVPDSASGVPVAWGGLIDYPNDLFDNLISLYRIDAGFTPMLGFVQRTGIWESTGHSDFQPRPHIAAVRQLDFELIPDWDIIANEQGSLARVRDWQTATLDFIPLGIGFQSGDEMALHVQRFMDAPTDPFNIFRTTIIQPGRYWWTRGQVEYVTSSQRAISVSAHANWGGFYDGHDFEEDLSATWRSGGHTVLGANLTRSQVRLSTGHFTGIESGARVEYAFNTRTDLLGFVQFDNETDRVDFDFRLHWTPVIGDDLYIVWNSGYTTDPGARFRFPERQVLASPLSGALTLKYVHRIAP
jgi:Domain of unknown function (DUF5916)/Carbohydrate family 9 binding domain-like